MFNPTKAMKILGWIELWLVFWQYLEEKAKSRLLIYVFSQFIFCLFVRDGLKKKEINEIFH